MAAVGRSEIFMRSLILALLAASGAAFVVASPAHAVGTRYPFCIQGGEFPGLSNCTFTSYEQCKATASGRYLTCIANPYYQGAGDLRDERRSRRRHNAY
jgi:hypothetical protein